MLYIPKGNQSESVAKNQIKNSITFIFVISKRKVTFYSLIEYNSLLRYINDRDKITYKKNVTINNIYNFL